MSLYRNDIRDAIIAALKAAGTMAGNSVYQPDDWPTGTPAMPLILVNAPHERKESLVRGAPSFRTTATIVAIGRVSGTSMNQVQADIETLCEQMEQAVLTDQMIPQMIQQFASVETQVILTSESRTHIAEATIAFAAEFDQFFEPAGGLPLTEIQLTLTSIDPIVITGDLVKGSVLISNVSNIQGLVDGMSIAGAGIQSNTTIQSIASNGSMLTLSFPATATGSTVPLNCVGTGTAAPAQPTADILLPQ